MISENPSRQPLVTIADMFGYLLTFLIVWFIWTSYKAASNAAEQAKNSAIEKVTPVVTTIQTETVRLKEASEEKAQEITEPSFWESLYGSTMRFFWTLSESPGESLLYINDSINDTIGVVNSGPSRRFENRDELDENGTPKKRGKFRDSLSSF